MLHAIARHPARPDLAALRDELAEQVHVLVVDVVDPLLAEQADLLLLLLLPALLFLLSALALYLRHPVASPPSNRRRRRPPPTRSSSNRPCHPGARASP